MIINKYELIDTYSSWSSIGQITLTANNQKNIDKMLSEFHFPYGVITILTFSKEFHS